MWLRFNFTNHPSVFTRKLELKIVMINIADKYLARILPHFKDFFHFQRSKKQYACSHLMFIHLLGMNGYGRDSVTFIQSGP